ncbi:Pfs NACHT and ankyrin domain protein [Penicillium sp. IBT 35674x]|nr:Pfs NACHT and ankyrin domain protein [Penicillium sp. IBT 35674x]
MAAARAMLENIHKLLPVYEDDNAYVLGSLKQHNIVIACLPAEGYGTNNAAKVMTNIKRTFPSIYVSLMVGIGGGVPIKHDIRLGDVVVGTRVMQYDLGKIVEDGKFQRTAFYRNPGHLLGTAVSALRARHELGPSRISFILQENLKHPNYTHPSSPDRLFQATYDHCSSSMESCDNCDRLKIISRTSRDDVRCHYGAIASGNQVMKHGTTRDNIARELDVICFEMEAAGIMDILPCLPIRGICDYSDSHKNKEWQRYAAATAAAYARELLEEIHSINERPALATSNLSDPSKYDYFWYPCERTQRSAAHTQYLDQSELEARRRLLLKSLEYEQIDYRKIDIKAEHSKTCQWLLDHSSYKAWLDPANLVRNHGFLWISGKPGAGKSTIMKFAYLEHAKSHSGSAVTASFFFNARGQYLEKSIIGMYRSLLLQLLEGYPELQTVLDNPQLVPPHQKDCPSLNALKSLFRDALFALGQRSFTCFVDALDECDEQQVVDMVRFFEDLAEESTAKGILFRICFSSRHYPYISIQWGVKVTLEDQSGHAEDLAAYISSRLRVEDQAVSEQFKSQLLLKAHGVFMWVILVVDMLNKESRRGGMALGKRLEQIPSELSDLFKDILTRDKEDMEALLLCILWILYAKKPLRPQEFFHALWSGLSLKGLVDDRIPRITDLYSSDGLGKLDRYVISSSKGLAETSKSDQPVVQFIHESIRDFLIKDKGLQQLWPEFGFDCESQSHEILKQCCSQYMSHMSVCASVASVSSAKRQSQKISGSYTGVGIRQECPFLNYATEHIFHHANAAAKLVPQDDFLSSFPISNWISSSNSLSPERYSPGATLIYILAEKGGPELVRTRLKVNPQIHVLGERHKYPLFAALENFNEETFVALLESPRISKGADNITDNDGNTPMQLVTKRGYKAIAELLIDKGANVNAKDKCGRTPLLQVLMDENEELARLLIDNGANVNDSDDNGWSPLLWAVVGGNKEIARLLINKGANVNISDKYGWSPLLRALMGGNDEIARLLIDKAAKVTDEDGWSPMIQSLIVGNWEIPWLVEKGARIGPDNEWSTAATCGHRTMEWQLGDSETPHWLGPQLTWD